MKSFEQFEGIESIVTARASYFIILRDHHFNLLLEMQGNAIYCPMYLLLYSIVRRFVVMISVLMIYAVCKTCTFKQTASNPGCMVMHDTSAARHLSFTFPISVQQTHSSSVSIARHLPHVHLFVYEKNVEDVLVSLLVTATHAMVYNTTDLSI